MSVLITEALSAKAYRLKNAQAHEDVLMGDFNDIPDVMLRTGAMKKLPHPNSAAYPHQMLTFCLDNSVSNVFLCNRLEFEALEKSMQLFSEYNINIQLVNNDL